MTQTELTMDVTSEALNTKELRYIGVPRQYRADCKAGQFKIGAGRMIGKSIKMEIIAARFVEDELFGYPFQKWVNVIFADEKGTVSSVMLKTESLDNFLEAYRQAFEQNKSLVTVQLEASMSSRSNDNGKYFAVEFAIVGDGKFTEAITAFRQELPAGIYRVAIASGVSNSHSDDTDPNFNAEENAVAAKVR